MGTLTQTEGFQRDLLRLSRDDQWRVFEATLKLQRDSRAPGLQMKRMQRTDFWEIRASHDLRIVAQIDGDNVFCICVGHHDDALKRAERASVVDGDRRAAIARKASALVAPSADGHLEPAQTIVSAPVDAGPLGAYSDEALTATFGVPPEWIAPLRQQRTQDDVLSIGLEDAMPEDAFWQVVELFARPSTVSTGAKPVYRIPSEAIARAFIEGEITQLEYNLPSESWAIVRSTRRAPIFVKGGAGSGKTLVAIYRALHVLEEPRLEIAGTSRVLYVTYTRQLRDDARHKVERLRGRIPDGLTIETFDAVASRLAPGRRTLVKRDECLPYAAKAVAGTPVDAAFFLDEVQEVIEHRNIRSAEAYAKLPRKGRGARLPVGQRDAVWAAYERYRALLSAADARDLGMVRMDAADRAAGLSDADRYDTVIVDEVQDLPWSVLAMVTSLARGGPRAKSLMLVGDAGQSIYQSGFRWSEIGLRIVGGSVYTLSESERNTREILAFAQAVIARVPTDDAQGERASKSGARPVVVHGFRDVDHRREWLAAAIVKRIAAGADPAEIAVVAHGHNELRALAAELAERDVRVVEQKSSDFYRHRAVKLLTAHSAKGLEFAEVYVPDANDGTYPFYKNAELPSDERDERDAQDCKLLYVALTRAKDRLTVLYDREPSPFLQPALPYADIIDVARPPAATRR